MDYRGIIIEESLGNKSILKELKILDTEVEQVAEQHKTPWLLQWTLHTVLIPENEADEVAKKISGALEPTHAWYADFKNKIFHLIIFHGKVFKVERESKDQYEKVTRYGVSLGIPKHQLDFSPQIK